MYETETRVVFQETNLNRIDTQQAFFDFDNKVSKVIDDEESSDWEVQDVIPYIYRCEDIVEFYTTIVFQREIDESTVE